MPSVMVGRDFGRVGLSGLEPLTSALSGEHGRRLMARFTPGQRPAWSTVVSWSPASSSSSLTSTALPRPRGRLTITLVVDLLFCRSRPSVRLVQWVSLHAQDRSPVLRARPWSYVVGCGPGSQNGSRFAILMIGSEAFRRDVVALLSGLLSTDPYLQKTLRTPPEPGGVG